MELIIRFNTENSEINNVYNLTKLRIYRLIWKLETTCCLTRHKRCLFILGFFIFGLYYVNKAFNAFTMQIAYKYTSFIIYSLSKL